MRGSLFVVTPSLSEYKLRSVYRIPRHKSNWFENLGREIQSCSDAAQAVMSHPYDMPRMTSPSQF